MQNQKKQEETNNEKLAEEAALQMQKNTEVAVEAVGKNTKEALKNDPAGKKSSLVKKALTRATLPFIIPIVLIILFGILCLGFLILNILNSASSDIFFGVRIVGCSNKTDADYIECVGNVTKEKAEQRFGGK